MAGGLKAVWNSVEGAEDSVTDSVETLSCQKTLGGRRAFRNRGEFRNAVCGIGP